MMHPRRLLLRGSILVAIGGAAFVGAAFSAGASAVRVAGAGAPNLIFACCEAPERAVGSQFADEQIMSDLRRLHAGVAVALTDFSDERAAAIRALNAAGIPVVAWVELPAAEGRYATADNASAVAARVAELEAWTSASQLRWTAIGLDIEPDARAFRSAPGGRMALVGRIVRRAFDRTRLRRAQEAYALIVNGLRAHGYEVQTYQLPLIADARRAGSTLPERVLGIVDVRADREVLMLYTSAVPSLDSALIWKLGPDAQAIAVGSTDGPPGAARLGWTDFSRDLVVASHFTRTVGVYDLEGVVAAGFLPRLLTFDWGQTVTISGSAIRRVNLLATAGDVTLWSLAHVAYFAAAAVLLLVGWQLRRRAGGRRAQVQAGSVRR